MNPRTRTDTTGPGRARRVRRAARRGTPPDPAELRARATALFPKPSPPTERRAPSRARPPQEPPPVRVPRRPSLDGPGTGRRVVRRPGAGDDALLPRAEAIAVAREAARRVRADRHRGRPERQPGRTMATRADPASRATATAPAATDPQARRQRARAWLAVRERLPLWVQLRCGVEPKTLVALVVVLVVAVGFAAHHMWSGRPQAVTAPEAEGRPGPDPLTEPVPQPSPGPVPSAPPQGGKVVVDIAGKVHKPGVHRLPRGARVADALEAAGGIEPGTETDGLNRARVLADGEQIVVGETAEPGAQGPVTGGSAPGSSGPVSLNSATAEQLETLPGIGPVLAQHIIDFRTQHGGFSSVDQLREVNGIGERRFADLQPLVGP